MEPKEKEEFREMGKALMTAEKGTEDFRRGLRYLARAMQMGGRGGGIPDRVSEHDKENQPEFC